jgi:hypothetical protein
MEQAFMGVWEWSRTLCSRHGISDEMNAWLALDDTYGFIGMLLR